MRNGKESRQRDGRFGSDAVLAKICANRESLARELPMFIINVVHDALAQGHEVLDICR